MNRKSELLHYMANFGGRNEANPYAGELRKSADSEDITTPMEHVLLNPEKEILGEITLRDYLARKLSLGNWHSGQGKNLPRILIALLIEGDPEKVVMVNEFIKALAPFDETQKAHQHTDAVPFVAIRNIAGGKGGAFADEYDDFTICLWTRLYAMANADPTIRLDADTKKHIFENLLKLKGPEFTDAISGTENAIIQGAGKLAGFKGSEKGLLNSENHILMINSSKYIRNQLENADSNTGTELETNLCAFLTNIYEHGLVEFNSIPYSQYTIEALLNLHDFANNPIKDLAKKVLDKIFYDHVIHSTRDGQSLRPFARQLTYTHQKDFRYFNPARAYMSTLTDGLYDINAYCHSGQSRYADCAFLALTTSYKLPKKVYNAAANIDTDNTQYLALTGQQHGNAEVSYKHSKYLLSGGGVRSIPTVATTATNLFNTSLALNASAQEYAAIELKRNAAEVVTEPPTVILNGNDTLDDSFFIGTDVALQSKKAGGGPGIDSMGHNNTGIYFDLMVGDRPVHVPANFQGTVTSPNYTGMSDVTKLWKLYEIEPDVHIAVFDGLLPFEKKKPASLMTFFGGSKKKEIERRQVSVIMMIPGSKMSAQDLINTIARDNDTEKLKGHVKFPAQCDSVIKDQTVQYDVHAALERWVIRGCNDVPFIHENRVFIKTTSRRDSTQQIPGWSAHSIIQTAPDQAPVSLLEAELPACYEFLDINKNKPNKVLSQKLS